jgi:hypothetical protein
MAKAKAATTEAAPKGRKPNPDSQNGVAPPSAKTAGAMVWEIADRIHAKGDQPVPSAVIEQVTKKNPDMNVSTIKTQLARWRQFHGMVQPRKAA